MAGIYEPTGVSKLSRDEKLELFQWLFSLECSELHALAQQRLAAAFPTAPKEMLHTAEHHLYVDGKNDALDWVADMASFLRSPDAPPPDLGVAFGLLHHLYNWWQFRDLLPEGKEGLLGIVKEAREFIKEGSPEAALHSLQLIEESLEGNVDFPKFGM